MSEQFAELPASLLVTPRAGQSLPSTLRHKMETSFGTDLSDVRVHVDSSPRDIGAKAYTHGTNIHVDSAHYNPDNQAGQELLGHELVHVQQQRAGRVATPQGKDAGINADPALEAEADKLGAMAAHGTQVTVSGATGAGGPQRKVIQRKMGMEFEVGRRITTAQGGNLPGDTNMLDHQYFKVVSDKRSFGPTGNKTRYSNIEIVLKAFDQLAGTDPNALLALTTRLDAVEAFYNLIYADDNDHTLSTLHGVGTGQQDIYNPLLKNTGNLQQGTWADAKIAPKIGGHLPPGHDNGTNRGKLFCHFTVGFPTNKLHDAINYLQGHDGPPQQPRHRDYNPGTRARGTEAKQLADTIAAKGYVTNAYLTRNELAELKGAVSLLYTQAAAFAVKSRGNQRQRGTQIKNLTPVLSRVPLREIADTLNQKVQQVLWTNYENIIDEIADGLDGTANFNDNDERELDGLDVVTLGDYTKSGLGRHNEVSQEQVFGGMYECGPDQDYNLNLIPIEIRSFKKQLMTFAEVRTAAAELLLQSRQIIDLPQQQLRQQQELALQQLLYQQQHPPPLPPPSHHPFPTEDPRPTKRRKPNPRHHQ